MTLKENWQRMSKDLRNETKNWILWYSAIGLIILYVVINPLKDDLTVYDIGYLVKDIVTVCAVGYWLYLIANRIGRTRTQYKREQGLEHKLDDSEIWQLKEQIEDLEYRVKELEKRPKY